MAKYRGQEGFGVEPVHGCGRVRDHAGCAGDGAQQGDLPDAFAPAAAPQEVPVLPGVEFAGCDRVVGIPPDRPAGSGPCQLARGRRPGPSPGLRWRGREVRRTTAASAAARSPRQARGRRRQGRTEPGRGRGGQRQHDRGADQREPVSFQVDQQRYEQRAQRIPDHREPLEDAEDPAHQLERNRTLPCTVRCPSPRPSPPARRCSPGRRATARRGRSPSSRSGSSRRCREFRAGTLALSPEPRLARRVRLAPGRGAHIAALVGHRASRRQSGRR